MQQENENKVTNRGEQPEGTSAAPQTAAPTTPKRGPGTKEVVPLAWKLVGISDGMPVTLLKCIDRAEAEAQLERLQSERYYSDLAIYEIDAEVPVPASAVKAREKAIGEAMSLVAVKSARTRSKGRGSKAAASPKTRLAATKKPKAAAKAKPKPKAKAKASKAPKRGGAAAAKAKSSKRTAKKAKAATRAKKKTKAVKSKKTKGARSAKALRKHR